MPWLSGIQLPYDCNCLCAHLRLRPPRRRRVRRRARGPLLPRQTTSRDWVSAAAAPPYSEHGAALRGCTRHNSSPDSTSGFMHHACSQEHFRWCIFMCGYTCKFYAIFSYMLNALKKFFIVVYNMQCIVMCHFKHKVWCKEILNIFNYISDSASPGPAAISLPAASAGAANAEYKTQQIISDPKS